MNHDRFLFPHTKIDWKITDLTQKVSRGGGNVVMLIRLMKLHLSKAMFHDGNEEDCAQVIRHARRVLQEDAVNLEALSMRALSLVYLGREEEAWKYLVQVEPHLAEASDTTMVHLALGVYYKAHNQIANTIEHWARALEQAPKVWEIHRLIGKAYLLQYHDPSLEKAHQKRLGQRSLYHLIQALQSRSELELDSHFLKELGYACLINGKNQQAERYFNRLRQTLVNTEESSYYLGLVAFELGKFNNAVQHFRNFLNKHPDHVDIISKKAKAWYNLGEFERAKGVAQQCLVYEPHHLDARLILGQSLLQLGNTKEATRVFQETLNNNWDHIETFQELVALRLHAQDVQWLQGMLSETVEYYASIPSNADTQVAEVVRQQIGVILGALVEVGAEMIPTVLDAIHCSQDEHLRFALWEVAVYMTQQSKAQDTALGLEQAKTTFGLELGCAALGASELLSEDILMQGLNLTEEDIRAAAHTTEEMAYDVQEHRQRESRERQTSRAYQALVLLSIAKKGSEKTRLLLREWAKVEDLDMAVAAKIGLALNGEVSAFEELQKLTQTTNRKRLLKNIRQGIFQATPNRVQADFLFSETEACQICSASGKGPHHFIRTDSGGICDGCISKSVESPMAADDGICVFCNRNFFLSNRIVHHHGHDICSTCQNESQQLVEQNAIEQFFHNKSIYFGR